jgi:hypothetical protein
MFCFFLSLIRLFITLFPYNNSDYPILNQADVEDYSNYDIFLIDIDAFAGPPRLVVVQLELQKQLCYYHFCIVRFPSSVVWCFGTRVRYIIAYFIQIAISLSKF